jgi:hypothetical protein
MDGLEDIYPKFVFSLLSLPIFFKKFELFLEKEEGLVTIVEKEEAKELLFSLIEGRREVDHGYSELWVGLHDRTQDAYALAKALSYGYEIHPMGALATSELEPFKFFLPTVTFIDRDNQTIGYKEQVMREFATSEYILKGLFSNGTRKKRDILSVFMRKKVREQKIKTGAARISMRYNLPVRAIMQSYTYGIFGQITGVSVAISELYQPLGQELLGIGPDGTILVNDHNGAVYRNFVAQFAQKSCGMLGLELPDYVASELEKTYDFSIYEMVPHVI